MRLRVALVLCLALVASRGVHAQSLQERLGITTGTVRMSYPVRQGVCGNGRSYRFDGRFNGDWMDRCEAGPVRVQLEKDGDRIASIRMYIGSGWRSGTGATATDIAARGITDLGEVSAREASDWLLETAGTANPRVAQDAIAAAAVADAPDPWQRLLALARDRSLHQDVRGSAAFWTGQSAAREATSGLAELADSEVESTEVQKAAVFALSRRDEPERIEHLIRIARTHANPEVVRSAFFWLADSADARALDLFEEVLAVRASAQPVPR